MGTAEREKKGETDKKEEVASMRLKKDRWAKMAHKASGMARMEDPAKGFSEIVGRIDDTGDMAKFKVTLSTPVLDGKVLYINVTRALSRLHCIDHTDGRDVVFVEEGGSGLSETNLLENKTEVLGNFGGRDSSKKLGLGGRGGGDRLGFGTPSDGATGKHKNIAGSRAALAEIVGMGRVNITNEFKKRGGLGDGGVNAEIGSGVRDLREIRTRRRAPIMQAPVDGGPEVESNSFEGREMDTAWGFRKLRESGDGVANVGLADNVGIQQFTKESTIGKTKLFLKFLMLKSVLCRTYSIVETGDLGG
jgi:hypothetical protein